MSNITTSRFLQDYFSTLYSNSKIKTNEGWTTWFIFLTQQYHRRMRSLKRSTNQCLFPATLFHGKFKLLLVGITFFIGMWTSGCDAANIKTRKGKCKREIATLTDLKGTVETPGYPKRYKNNQICIWHIKVRHGFQIRISLDLTEGFGIEDNENCLKGDSLIISTKRQTFQRYKQETFKSGSHSLVLCGKDGIKSTIVSPSNEIWLRFRADRRKSNEQIGFRAKYNATDINECLRSYKRRGCEQICINTMGSYRCACGLGFRLAADRRSCEDINECALTSNHHGCSHGCRNFKGTYHCRCPYGKVLDSTRRNCVGGIDYEVRFSTGSYRSKLNSDAPVGTKVLQMKALGISRNNKVAKKRVRFNIVQENNSSSRKDFTFSINPSTGELMTRKLVSRSELTDYVLLVKAKIDEWIYGTTKVFIHINGTQNINNVTEIERSFTILVHQDLRPKSTVFDLGHHYHSKHFSFIYGLQKASKYFAINPSNGRIYTVVALDNVTLSKLNWRHDLNVVIYRKEFHSIVKVFRCRVIVFFLPAFPGEKFLTPEILNSVSRELSNDLGYLDGRVRFFSKGKVAKVPLQVIGLHRLFRRPSEESRIVSKAKLYFDKILEKVQNKVEESYVGRERSGPVIFNLGTQQIVSPEKLSGIIDASKCKEALPTPNCIDIFPSRYRTFDGKCNNVEHPLWGAATTPFRRLLPPVYYDVDGLSDPVGFPNLPEAPDLPSPHEISRLFFIPSHVSKGNEKLFSLMLMQWGQFVDHDITFTAESEGGHHCILPRCDGNPTDFKSPCFPIMYPGNVGDCTMFIRSAAVCQTSQEQIESRQQMNTITAFIDGSVVYGSSEKDSRRLRTLDGSGELKLQFNSFLPFIDAPLNPPLSFCRNFGGCFDAGDVRVNEQVSLASLHTLFVREHNRVARQLRRINRHWEGINIYQEARKIVGALIQHITYSEYLPKVLGINHLPAYSGYNEKEEPSIANVFATAAFRFGHSMVRQSFPQLNENFDPVSDDLPLFHAFFNNTLLLKTGIERFLFGLIGNKSETVDRKVAFDLLNRLFQRPGASHGFNLMALNIQRGRDHGLPGYGAWRRYCNLENAENFEETAKEIGDRKLREILRALYYDRVEYADVFVAGLAEDHIPGALVGPTFHCLIKKQFQQLRIGDRYYYENENVFSSSQLREIRKGSLARIMCDNLKGMVSVQPDVFLAVSSSDRRVSCDRIPSVHLENWSENTAVSDGGGHGHWSQWVSSSRFPSGSWATVFQKPLCTNETVTDIECQTENDMPYTNAGEEAFCDKRFGIYCRDADQKKENVKCSYYRFRLRCVAVSTKDEGTKRTSTGYPQQKTPPSLNCTKSSRYVKEGGLGILAFTVRDFAMLFPPSDETVLDDPYKISAKSEYIIAGKVSQDRRKRILMKFDLRRVKRYDVLHSAVLQLFFVGFDEHFTENSLKSYHPRATTIETFLVTGTNWTSNNVTSRIPWHGDFLKIGKDTELRRISKTIVATEQPTWVELDVYSAVYRWRISRLLRVNNYGLLIKIADDDYPEGVFRFASSSHDNESIRPRLRVCMTATAW